MTGDPQIDKGVDIKYFVQLIVFNLSKLFFSFF